jgi:DNA gyrase subunit A
VDGDPPAAMRYTEARLTSAAVDILAQLDRNTIDFTRNFDDSLDEPDVLPAAIPNLLINGASGIAVGMATSIPPHNLGEVVDACNLLLEKWEAQDNVTVSDLMKYVKGPDFPTGGIILHENIGEDLLSAYATGRGKVTLRGKVHLEEMGRGKNRIIITELPYQINKASLIERVAELAREGELEGISDLRDESDRQGMRIVIELNKVAETENVLRALYRRTPLQTTFRISLLALVNGEPHLLSLKQALRVYLEHRIEVIRRRSEYDLNRAKERAHILEGLRVALNNLDEVINLIRSAQDVETARVKLMKRFKLTVIQANAILEMQLRRLAALERRKIETEYKEILVQIQELEGLLRSPRKLREVVGNELKAMKAKYADRRRTQIVALKDGAEMKDLLTTTDMMPSQDVWVVVTRDGLIGRTMGEKIPKWTTKTAPRWLYSVNTHQTLYLVASDGRAAAISVQALPEIEAISDGIPLYKASPFEESQKLVGIIAAPPKLEEGEEHYVVTTSRNGLVKKSSLRDLPGPSTQLFQLVRVNAGDEIGWVMLTDGKSEILLATARGMVIRFAESEVRPMGLVAAGVNGIKLSAGDQVVGATRCTRETEVLLVSEDGKGWRLPNSQLPIQGRYGQGAIACRPSAEGGLIGMVSGFPGQDFIVHFEDSASKVLTIDSIPTGRRQSAGKILINLKPGERIERLTVIEDGAAYWDREETHPPKPPRGWDSQANKADQLSLPLESKRSRARKTSGTLKPKPADKIGGKTRSKPGTNEGITPSNRPTPKGKSTGPSEKAGKHEPGTSGSKPASARPKKSQTSTRKLSVDTVKTAKTTADGSPGKATTRPVAKTTAAKDKKTTKSSSTKGSRTTNTTSKPTAGKTSSVKKPPSGKSSTKSSKNPASKKTGVN